MLFFFSNKNIYVGNSQGQLTCVKMGQVRGMTSVSTLAAPGNYLGRVWTSLTRTTETRDQPMSLAIAPGMWFGNSKRLFIHFKRIKVKDFLSSEFFVSRLIEMRFFT